MSSPHGSELLINKDLAPTRMEERSWNLWHIASLWVGMSVCIPTYMLAASMVGSGMNWWQSLLTILLGNAIVLVPLVLNAHAGTRYGIPFPVLIRAPFGVFGAHVPSLLRALVACGWFGIQTWIGGTAINAILTILIPGWSALGSGWTLMGYGFPDYAGFLIFWVINLYFVWSGTESIKLLETVAAPFLILVGLALLYWAISEAGGISAILAESDRLVASSGNQTPGRFLTTLFIPWLTAMVGYWATLSLNIPDFTRYAKSQKDQMLGQAVGLLTTMPLFAFIGVAVTTVTVLRYGEAIWNPVDLLARLVAEYRSPLLGLLAMAALAIATLSTNIAANVVAPANSFSSLLPSRIGFRTGGLIAALIGVFILPWKLLELYQTWLIAYSGLLGAVTGVMICDYFVIRRCQLDLNDLYRVDGVYSYQRGINHRAMAALAGGILLALLGKVSPALAFLFDGAWFFATGAAFVIYWLLMRTSPVLMGSKLEG